MFQPYDEVRYVGWDNKFLNGETGIVLTHDQLGKKYIPEDREYSTVPVCFPSFKNYGAWAKNLQLVKRPAQWEV
jgi:hypothetical protein